MALGLAGSLALAALSFLLAPPAPSYDAWAWLLWGRELLDGELNTLEGPAFKPLPVAVCALLAMFGPAAPWLWVLVARAGAILAVGLAFRLGRHLGEGSLLAGALAAVGVVLCGPYVSYAASGLSEGLLLALALAAGAAWGAGRPRLAVACALGCAMLRVETWPFLAAAAAVVWRRRPQDRALLVAAALVVPAAWFIPEMIGSGEPLRSAERARVPNPGQPALASVPALASLREAVALPLWPLWLGVVLLVAEARRRGGTAARAALAPAAAGLAWIALVAVMAQAGFSGEARYALPGAALVALSGAAGLAANAKSMVRWASAAAAAGLVVLAALPRADDLSMVLQRQAHQGEMQADLPRAVAAAGGAGAVLACGTVYVGPLRGPLLAWHLGVAKHTIEPDRPPQPPGVVFRSSLETGHPRLPSAPDAFREVLRVPSWEVLASC